MSPRRQKIKPRPSALGYGISGAQCARSHLSERDYELDGRTVRLKAQLTELFAG
ncbi:uncharacterized protein PHACADRAFT_246653 [Phanerochaete carnosa HHB-10118-sp]|uniref:Uncharacterized protein n=1 Tax=Phanerochaete carnosa (strain HHB-10118-sp) TaxID=650164 RepID=K5W9H5_PHACS|nr:uncharacterized protein PHACADRAFT_246653 [Phanerochaete carnosa HHB-10118-sp]EKM60613.1 hypothetical protein PHACADRAFT_246653 [Phanerochaete carnosa HHB-10118-sp]